MKFITKFSVTILVLFMPGFISGQDIIIKRTNDTIHGKVSEIGVDFIKYTLPDYPEDLNFNIDKNNVKLIIFSNGKEMTFTQEMTDPDNYADNKKHAIKVDFIAPLTGNTTLGIERSLMPGRSIEAALGLIGIGVVSNETEPAGAFIKIGYKFIKSPDFYLRGMRYAHILKGGYVKPEIQFGFYSRKQTLYEYDYSFGYYEYYTKVKSVDVFTGALLLNIGKQWIYDNFFLLDIFGGIGYGFDTNPHSSGGYHYGFVLVDDKVPISFSGGIKIGILVK